MTTTTPTPIFDYATLDAETRIVVQQRAVEIKAILRQPETDIIRVAKFTRKGREAEFYPCTIAISSLVREADGRYAVYGLVDPKSGEIFYVGSSQRILDRIRQHCAVRASNRQNPLVERKLAIAARGASIGCIVLAICRNPVEMQSMEQHFIDRYEVTILNVQRNRWRHERKY